MQNEYLTVSQLNKYIKYKLDNDTNLQDVYLKGEISNFKAHTRGHFYFTIKDEGSRISAIMFSSSAKKLAFTPEDGMKILVQGKIAVYEANGAYQIYVNEMLEDGVGNLYVAFEQLKKKLSSLGYFDETNKKSLPRIPKRVGVVTASTGAAIRDIISTINRRFPLTEVYLFPSLVQGSLAKDDIVKQIARAKDYDIDVLIVGRGGGSIEDLWAFNEEEVALAIYNCEIPIISAVGHEIDFTISDFVADLRAPTPTASAELAVPNSLDIKNYLRQQSILAYKNLMNNYNRKKQKLDELKNSYILNNPLELYSAKEQKLDHLYDELRNKFSNIITSKSYLLNNLLVSNVIKEPSNILLKKINKYEVLVSKLDALSPLKTLKRGFSIIKKKDKFITSVKDIKKNDDLEINFSDGKAFVKVLEEGEEYGEERVKI